MNEEEMIALREFSEDDTIISIDELTDKSERTLLYGYNYDKGTWHVYLKNDEIHVFVYERHYNFNSSDDIETMYHVEGREINITKHGIIPNKRLYPETCDFEFCKLLKKKGIDLPFTTFQEREPKQYYGELYIFG